METMMRSQHNRNVFLISLFLTLLLSGCGGGGGSLGTVDTTAPTIVSTYPANGTSGVVTTTPVRVTFDEPIDSTTLTTNSFSLATTLGGAAVSGTVSYDASGDTATFTPGAALASSTQYTATITTAVTDAAGNALAANHSWSFTTAAASAQWQPLGGQVSTSDSSSEDPTMLVTNTTPSVGYRHASFDIDLNTWDGVSSWGSSKVHPQSGNINGSIYSTPGFASDGTNIFVTYSLAGVSGSTNDAFYDRIYLDQCTTTTAWTSWNSGVEISTPYSGAYGGANAWEPAVAAVSGFNPMVGWVEADVVANPDTEDGAWLADVTLSSSVRSTILSRDNTVASWSTDVRTVGVTMDSSGNAYMAQWESDAVDQNRTNLYVSSYDGSSFTSLGGAISADYDYNNLSVPSMVVIGSELYVAYTEANAVDYTQHVYVKKYNGSSWSLVGGGPVSAFSASEHYDSGSPSLANVNGTLYLAWDESDQTSGSYIFVARWDSTASAWVIDGDRLNVDTAREALDPSLAYSSLDNTLYVAFEEYVSGWPQIFVKRKLLP